MKAAITMEQVQACLLGVAIGDAMGMPVETMTAEEILSATNRQGILGFMPPIQTRFRELRQLYAGETTDDWQLTKTVAESFIECGCFDLEDIAKRHVEAMERSTVGWGGTTRKAVAQIHEYFETYGRSGRNPLATVESFGLGTGAGNGVAMKVAPLVLFSVLADDCDNCTFTDRLLKFATMTHADLRAYYPTYALALAMTFSLQSQVQTADQAKQVIERIISHLAMAADLCGLPREPETFAKLKKLPELIGNPQALAEAIGTSCLATESVLFSLGVYLTFPTDFRKAVLTAVNAGGDTDTNAAMVGALVGANCGLTVIPIEWREFNPCFNEALVLGRLLHEKAIMATRSR